MMKTIGLAAALIGSMLTTAHAEFAFTAENAYEHMNKAARSLKVENRFTEGECTTGVQAVCKFWGEGVAGLVTADTPSSRAREMTIIYMPDGDTDSVLSAMVSWGTVLQATDPKMTRKKRGEILSELMEAVQDRSSRSTVVKGVEYSLMVSETVGVWFSASSKK